MSGLKLRFTKKMHLIPNKCLFQALEHVNFTGKHFYEQCPVDKLYMVVDKVAENNELKCGISFLAL